MSIVNKAASASEWIRDMELERLKKAGYKPMPTGGPWSALEPPPTPLPAESNQPAKVTIDADDFKEMVGIMGALAASVKQLTQDVAELRKEVRGTQEAEVPLNSGYISWPPHTSTPPVIGPATVWDPSTTYGTGVANIGGELYTTTDDTTWTAMGADPDIWSKGSVEAGTVDGIGT